MARNVKAARVLLPDYENNIDKLKAAEPWLFGARAAAPAQAGATEGRILFITPTLKGILDDFSLARRGQLREDRGHERHTGQDVLQESSGTYANVSSSAEGSLSNYYELVGAGTSINFMVAGRSTVIKLDKHVASHIFSPDEPENLESYMTRSPQR